MSRSIHLKIDAIRKKLNCSQFNCGENFVFEISDEKYKIVKHKAHYRYTGKCSRCGQILKLTSSGISALSIGFGKAEIKLMKTNFGDLFE
jgi:hypothetical protein